MSIDLTQTNLVPVDNKNLLEAIQGNILNGHGRNHGVHIFIKFEEGKVDAAREWIANFATKHVTSAWAQYTASQSYKETKKANPNSDKLIPFNQAIFGNFFLSSQGYNYLGLDGVLDQPDDNVFVNGAQNSIVGLGDPPLNEWETGFQEVVHAMALIASDDETSLLAFAEQLKRSLVGIGEVPTMEIGFVLKNDDGEVIEHFGYRDGISQPLFFDYLMPESETDKFDPSAPLNLVLLKDPNAGGYGYGSMMVYRKLEQDIEGWNNEVITLADKLNIAPELAGAYAVGRFKDGTPVELNNEPSGTDTNNFNFQEDATASKCPFHSHIRKTNPRGDTHSIPNSGQTISLELERSHRIARRAISYGSQTDGGLLFLCMQSSIGAQFEFQQKSWANQNQFVKQSVGLDTVIGQGTQVPVEGQNYPNTWGDDSAGFTRFNFKQFVKMQGGEYFFTPSMEFIQRGCTKLDA